VRQTAESCSIVNTRIQCGAVHSGKMIQARLDRKRISPEAQQFAVMPINS
jgi:hypothetical protein